MGDKEVDEGEEERDDGVLKGDAAAVVYATRGHGVFFHFYGACF